MIRMAVLVKDFSAVTIVGFLALPSACTNASAYTDGAPASTNGARAAAAAKPRASLTSETARQMIEERWGIDLESLRSTAGGYMLDFRYRVTDPAKAKPLMARRVEPSLVDLKSGTVLSVPRPAKVGPLRSKSDEEVAGRVHFIVFANPGRLVKPGDHVSVVVGDFRAEDLRVE